MRRRTCLDADQWAARLNAEMARVLRRPERFPPATVWWAEWRRTWLAESGSRLHEPAAQARTTAAAKQYSLPLLEERQ